MLPSPTADPMLDHINPAFEPHFSCFNCNPLCLVQNTIPCGVFLYSVDYYYGVQSRLFKDDYPVLLIPCYVYNILNLILTIAVLLAHVPR